MQQANKIEKDDECSGLLIDIYELINRDNKEKKQANYWSRVSIQIEEDEEEIDNRTIESKKMSNESIKMNNQKMKPIKAIDTNQLKDRIIKHQNKQQLTNASNKIGRRSSENDIDYVNKQQIKNINKSNNLHTNNLIHTGIKPFQCDICEKAFNQKPNLKNHKLIHSDVRSFTCEICNKIFKQQTGLFQHKKIHQDIKQFKCIKCKLASNYKKSLNDHLKVHRK